MFWESFMKNLCCPCDGSCIMESRVGWWDRWWQRTKRTDRAARVSENEKGKRGSSRALSGRRSLSTVTGSTVEAPSALNKSPRPKRAGWTRIQTRSRKLIMTQLTFSFCFSSFLSLSSFFLHSYSHKVMGLTVLNSYNQALHPHLLSPNWWHQLFYSWREEGRQRGRALTATQHTRIQMEGVCTNTNSQSNISIKKNELWFVWIDTQVGDYQGVVRGQVLSWGLVFLCRKNEQKRCIILTAWRKYQHHSFGSCLSAHI